MAPTHAYIGATLALVSMSVTGSYAAPSGILAASFLGGVLPDFDLVTSHRKTLHFPVLYPVAACLLAVLSLALGWQSLFLLAIAVGSAGVHSLTDIFAGGLGYEPWRGTSKKAVYNHVAGRWHRPRGLVRYSGAPEDCILCAVFAVPVFVASETGPTADAALAVVLVGAGLYTATRRRLSLFAASARSLLPNAILDRLPRVRFEES
jgi:hypothetical protein